MLRMVMTGRMLPDISEGIQEQHGLGVLFVPSVHSK